MLNTIYFVLGAVNLHTIYRILRFESEYKKKFTDLGAEFPLRFRIQNHCLKGFCAACAAWMFFMSLRV